MPKSIRTFIGSKDFQLSKRFYKEIGFEESIIDSKMSYFFIDKFGFYLQDYYVKHWINNSMVFLEVDNLEEWFQKIKALELPKKYKVKLTDIHYNEWGNEFFLHDPAGILWHFGIFTT